MIELKLVTYPNKILATKCQPVPVEAQLNDDPDEAYFPKDVKFCESLAGLLGFMRDLMKKTEAIGLAANQCNVPRRVFLMRRFTMCSMINGDLSFTPSGEIQVVVNPIILNRSVALRVFIEGCLSFPGKNVQTRRPSKIMVGYYNENGKYHEEELDGLESIIFQHEYDHLQGKDMRDREFRSRQ